MSRREEELKREIRFHLDEQIAAEMAAGVGREEAERRAAWAMGAEDGVKEACREARPGHWLADLGRDLRHGVRLWRRQPWFTAMVLLILGLGIGATTIMVTLVNGVLFQPLAFAQPERLVSVQERTVQTPNATAVAEGWGNLWAVTYPNYEDLAHASRTLELGAWGYDGGIVSEPGPPAYVDADFVTAGLFPMLGVAPMAGRDFLAREDQPGGASVAIVSANLARERFGSAPGAVGRRINFAGRLMTIVGVMPPGFDLQGYTTADAADVYVPLGEAASSALQNRGRHFLEVAGRLRSGVTLAAAQQEAEVIAHRLMAEYPATNTGRDFQIEPWHADVGDARTTLWLLLGAAGLVLILACANVASLLLVRAIAREPEMAMRAALGAGSGRLARQCLAESALFGLGGGAIGIGLAATGLRPLIAIWPGSLPRAGGVALDSRVLVLALVVSLVSSFAIGLAPAWRMRLGQMDEVMRTGQRALGRTRRLQKALVAAEVAAALVLLAGAGILGSALLRMSALDLGVNPRGVITGRVALPASVLASAARTRSAWDALLGRVRGVVGVTAAATVDTVPLREGNNTDNYWIAPHRIPESERPTALATCVSADYFRAMGIPLLAGRVIDQRDRVNTQPVAVIDDVLARHAFGDSNPIGRQINIGGDMGNKMLTIVGVVRHVLYWGPAGDANSPVRDQVYYAFAQLPAEHVARWSELMSVAVRSGGASGEVLARVRRAVEAGGAALYDVQTMDELARGKLAQQRFLWLLFSVFAGLALLLASLGVYGVQAYLTTRRLPELGVRVALGASRAAVFGIVVRQSLGTLLAGIGSGVIATLAMSGLLRHAVAGVGGVHLLTLLAVGLVLGAVSVAASLPPALRASRVDPAVTLRQE